MTSPELHPNVEWIGSYEGGPARPAPVSVFPYRNRVSLNTHHGCTLGCAYCINAADGFWGAGDQRVRRIATTAQVLEALGTLRGKIDGFRLSLGDWTDPFLDSRLQRDTIELVRGLAAAGCEQPVAITSKLCPPPALLRAIAREKLRTTLFVSLGSAGGPVERVPVESRVRLAREARGAGLHTVLLLRPLHPAWSRPDEFGAVLGGFAGSVDEVVLGGLRAPVAVRRHLASLGLDVDGAREGSAPALDANLERELLAVVNATLPGVPVARTRSCASNRRHGLPCMTPATALYPMPEVARRAAHHDAELVWRDWNGYCRLVPSGSEAGAGLSAPQLRALQALALILDAAPAIPWRLVGGGARVLEGMAATCDDLDVFVNEGHFDAALARLADGDRGLRIMGCKGQCSSCSDCPTPQPRCRLVRADSRVALVDLGGVTIDLSERPIGPGRILRRTAAGAMEIPVDLAA